MPPCEQSIRCTEIHLFLVPARLNFGVVGTFLVCLLARFMLDFELLIDFIIHIRVASASFFIRRYLVAMEQKISDLNNICGLIKSRLGWYPIYFFLKS